MKKIICLVITLLMTLPVYAKLTAHEEARINAMLEGLAQKKDLIFVRNGDEHTCDEAVSHLRLKLGNSRLNMMNPCYINHEASPTFLLIVSCNPISSSIFCSSFRTSSLYS